MIAQELRRLAVVIVGTVLANSQVSAQGIATAGVGSAPCSALNKYAKADRSPAMDENAYTLGVFAWAQGYMSGLNMGHLAAERAHGSGNDVFFDLASISIEEQWAFITVWCRQNPSKLIFDAVGDLVFKRLRPTR